MSKRYKSRNFKAILNELESFKAELSALDHRHSGLENKVNANDLVNWKTREEKLDYLHSRMDDIQVQLSKLADSMLVVRENDYEWFRKWLNNE